MKITTIAAAASLAASIMTSAYGQTATQVMPGTLKSQLPFWPNAIEFKTYSFGASQWLCIDWTLPSALATFHMLQASDLLGVSITPFPTTASPNCPPNSVTIAPLEQ